jgi:putative transposase
MWNGPDGNKLFRVTSLRERRGHMFGLFSLDACNGLDADREGPFRAIKPGAVQSPSRVAAEAATTIFAENYAFKHARAVERLIEDREQMLTFFDFPADHRDHLRRSNPIESVFATVRRRTVRIEGALSQDGARLMVFKRMMAASKTWRRLKRQNQLPKVIGGVKFKDGIEVASEIKSAA